MTNLCNLNGEIVPEEDAKISVLDRGFLFGDSIYEVTRTRQGIPFAWTEHLARLRGSAAGLEMEIGLSDREITQRVMATLIVFCALYSWSPFTAKSLWYSRASKYLTSKCRHYGFGVGALGGYRPSR